MKLVSKVWLDDPRLQGRQPGVAQDILREVHKALNNDVALVAAVCAMPGDAVDKRVVRADKVWADVPLLGVLGDTADEEEHRKGGSELVFLERDARGPVIRSVLARG